METEEIVYKLEEMNILFDENEFLEDVENCYSAQDISEKWFSLYPVNASGRDEDYPWFAATILWERLAPLGHLSLEQMFGLYGEEIDYLEKDDPVYFEKRIKFCREFCDLFPKQDGNYIRNMRVAIGESYWRLSKYQQAEVEFHTIIKDFPESPWGYMYLFYEKDGSHIVKELYKKAELIAKDEDDIEVVNERLEAIEREFN